MVVNAVPAGEYQSLWPWVRAGLEQVVAKVRADWEPEDVRQALVLGQAALYTIGQDQGFIVLQRQQRKGRAVLFVWAIWGPGELEPLQAQIMAELDALAKHAGAARIVHEGRRGWGREGFMARSINFEREVW